MYDRVFNFSAGPSALPLPVLERARNEMVNFEESGMSVMELSHRSQIYNGIMERAENGLRQALNVPDDYAVLFLQGGASFQFTMLPMNLTLEGKAVDALNTGVWTQKAIAELEKIAQYRIAGSSEAEGFTRLPRPDEISFNPNASYVHIASNNTIYGTQWHRFPDTGDAPLVADMSSDILSRPIDVSDFGVIFAGAQKNIGPAGVTIVIIRKDLAGRASDNLPTMLNYRTHISKGSMFNTPPTFGIYIIALVMEWIAAEGGVSAMEKYNKTKAALLYNAIDASDFYSGPVNKADRSLMNVVFRVKSGDAELEKQFVTQAAAAGLSNLKGHRSTGGIRASIYNAQPIEGVGALVEFMQQFEQKYG
ncbi:MAG TPA: 3-phosphoserine/phosphohydroxythreonine transaminase [Chloroflexi bacterium]|nr:3-phosphoserine/phosphohydroxythreonine transaminase [Chloroflexota bacterium]